MDFNKAIYLFMMYGFNEGTTRSFIRKVFSKDCDEYLLQHLEDKFDRIYDNVGWRAAFFYFWSELDSRVKHILENWIMNNYQG